MKPRGDRLAELVAAIPEELRPHHVERLGLRFVDQIQAPGVATASDWREYIVPSLIGEPDSLIFDDRVIQGLQRSCKRVQ